MLAKGNGLLYQMLLNSVAMIGCEVPLTSVLLTLPRTKRSDSLRGGCAAHVHLAFLDIVEWLGPNPPSAQAAHLFRFFCKCSLYSGRFFCQCTSLPVHANIEYFHGFLSAVLCSCFCAALWTSIKVTFI